MTKAKGIQIGDNTHSQDQVIVPVNFNAMNKIASKLAKLTPLPLLLVSDKTNHPPIKSLTETNETFPSPCGSTIKGITSV